MGAIPHLLRSNRTGERVLLIAAGKLCSLFIRRAYEQSGFNNSVRRIQCDHKPIIRRKQLDFVSTEGTAISGGIRAVRFQCFNIRTFARLLGPSKRSSGEYGPESTL